MTLYTSTLCTIFSLLFLFSLFLYLEVKKYRCAQALYFILNSFQDMLRKQYDKVSLFQAVGRGKKTGTSTATLFMQPRVFALSSGIAGCRESS